MPKFREERPSILELEGLTLEEILCRLLDAVRPRPVRYDNMRPTWTDRDRRLLLRIAGGRASTSEGHGKAERPMAAESCVLDRAARRRHAR